VFAGAPWARWRFIPANRSLQPLAPQWQRSADSGGSRHLSEPPAPSALGGLSLLAGLEPIDVCSPKLIRKRVGRDRRSVVTMDTTRRNELKSQFQIRQSNATSSSLAVNKRIKWQDRHLHKMELCIHNFLRCNSCLLPFFSSAKTSKPAAEVKPVVIYIGMEFTGLPLFAPGCVRTASLKPSTKSSIGDIAP
jgi:hypothetical protein